jgi:hypothetical protein
MALSGDLLPIALKHNMKLITYALTAQTAHSIRPGAIGPPTGGHLIVMGR